MAVADERMMPPAAVERLRKEMATFVHEHRRALQITGLVAVAGVTGGLGGLYVAKSLAAGKAMTVANLALAAKGSTAVPLSALLTPQTAGATTAVAANPVSTVATLQQVASTLNHSATTGVALVDKATALWNTLSTNALPLTAGIVGGGAAGVGATQGRVRKVQTQLASQLAQTESLQAETAHLQQALSTTQEQLQSVQTAINHAQITVPPTVPNTVPPTIPPTERLERIRGIGRVFAQQLNAAGIHTIADLAAQSPTTIEAIIGKSRAGSLFDPVAWIAEAQHLAAGTEHPLPTGTKPIQPAQTTPLETIDLVLERLEVIEGISAAAAARLNRGGILTYADLAAAHPEEVAALLADREVQSVAQITAWIETAQQLEAGGDVADD